jgi:hypothetical protein
MPRHLDLSRPVDTIAPFSLLRSPNSGKHLIVIDLGARRTLPEDHPWPAETPAPPYGREKAPAPESNPVRS